MNFLEKYNLSTSKILKISAIVFLGIIILSVAFSFVSNAFRSISGQRAHNLSSLVSPERFEERSMTNSVAGSPVMSKSMTSLGNIMPIRDDYTPGIDAEDFEITEYRANIETRDLDKTCNKVANLKTASYIIFESSNQGKDNCNFRFKVKKDNVGEVLAIVKSLQPREFNENVQTIKKQIDDFTSQEEILKRKLKSIEDTLSSAIVSYNEISSLATKTKDASSLANIIESKIRIIERLTTEKINITTQLEKISKAKAEKLDKLEYTYFNISIYENKYIDFDGLKDSWKNSVKQFVFDINKVLQDLSIGLIMLVAYVFQYLLYLFIIVITGKYVWKLFKRIWRA